MLLASLFPFFHLQKHTSAKIRGETPHWLKYGHSVPKILHISQTTYSTRYCTWLFFNLGLIFFWCHDANFNSQVAAADVVMVSMMEPNITQNIAITFRDYQMPHVLHNCQLITMQNKYIAPYY